jgi:hypothetical protein
MEITKYNKFIFKKVFFDPEYCRAASEIVLCDLKSMSGSKFSGFFPLERILSASTV